MSRAFRRQGEHIRMQLDPVEIDLLRSLHEGLRNTLTGGDVRDPVLERLFPAAVVGDDEADQELRRLLRDDLMQARLAGLEALNDLLDRGVEHRGHVRVRLDGEEAALVLGVLNDLRLAIGARIGVESLERDDLDPDDPVAYRLAVMDHLAWLQEQLLAILDPASVAHYAHRPDED